MLPLIIFAAESPDNASGFGALGINASAFIIQLITFIFVFMVLRRFAFKPIGRLLAERRKTIDDGVRAGLELAKEREKLKNEHTELIREARVEADKIISNSHKEARDIIREAEKAAARKADTLLSDAEVRIHEESLRAKRSLEKDIVSLISEATEAIVGEKIDPKKDGEIIDKILKSRAK